MPVVVTLALGIGANTATFSVINSVLLLPPPCHELEGLAGKARFHVVSRKNEAGWFFLELRKLQ